MKLTNKTQKTRLTRNRKKLSKKEDLYNNDVIIQISDFIAEESIRKRKYNGGINHKKYLTEPLHTNFVLYDFDIQDVSIAISSLNPRKESYSKMDWPAKI